MPTEKEYMLKQADAATTYQRKLTAGTGINIDQATDTISATGTGGSTVTWSGNYSQGNSLGVLSIDGTSNPIKMPNLVQGQHITISQDPTTGAYTISASAGDVMQGATSSTAGTAGLVPQPLAGDENKVLSGAGTWIAQSGGGGGGSNVSITPSLPRGTKIADYSIDGVSNELLAPIVNILQEDYDALPNTKNSDGIAYFITATKELDSNYTYHKYGENDEIVVRVYHEGETDEEIVWFFNGFTKTDSDWPIPSELQPYTPDVSTLGSTTSKTYDTSDSDTHTGWIGWSRSLGRNVIRSWNIGWNTTLAGTFYAVVRADGGDEQTNPYEDPYVWVESTSRKIMLNGQVFVNAGGGGSSVIPNPTDPATDTLTSIEIDNIVYDLPSGGSGGGNTITYGTTVPSAPANDGDTYFMLNANNQRQATYLYITNAWVQIEGAGGGGGTTPPEEAYSRIIYNTSSDIGVEGEVTNE